MAQDGTTMMLPRFKLIPTDLSNIKWAQTIPNRWNGTVEEILSYNPRTNKYRVKFTVPNSKSVIDEIPAINLRGKYPHSIAQIEEVFRKSSKNQNK